MVQTDISQLLSDCSEWRQLLRNYRDEFQEKQKTLQASCNNSLSKDQLQEVEYFNNQFHIQLINIHDLKQEVKNHDKQVQLATSKEDNVSEETYTTHDNLSQEVAHLGNMLQELTSKFQNFISTTNC